MIFAFVGPMVAIMLVSNHYNKTFHKINDLCSMSSHTNDCILTLLYNMEAHCICACIVGERCPADHQFGVASQVPVWEDI